MDLKLDQKMSRKVNEMEEKIRKLATQDIQKINNEVIHLNSSITKFCSEQRSLEEKVNKKLYTSKSVQK